MKLVLILTLCLVSLTTVKSNKHYQVIKLTKLNWYGAFVDCLSRGMNLATIESAEEQVLFENAVKRSNMASERLWTSGTDQNEEGNFVWMSSGNPVFYNKWSSRQPDNDGGKEHCLHVWPAENGIGWNDWECWNKLYYVCERKQACLC